MRELGYFLNIDKPPGVTSRDVVDRVAHIVGTKRVGHAGTLDPMATGVLVVAIERATRLVEYVQAQPKAYLAEFLLGQTSDTDDVEGELRRTDESGIPTRPAIEAALSTFVGCIEQRPPAYSALKIAGQRAYRLARMGRDVDLAPRPVEIHSIDPIEIAYPAVRLRIRCGSGTYIRSIARDLGEMLEVGGVMSRLRRESIGVFDEKSAIALDDLTVDLAQRSRLPLTWAVGALPRVNLDATGARRFQLGQTSATPDISDAKEVAVFASSSLLLGIGRIVDGILKPVKGGFAASGD